MGMFESDGVPGIEGVSSPVSTPRGEPIILDKYSSKSLSSAFGGGVLPLKGEISGLRRGGELENVQGMCDARPRPGVGPWPCASLRA